jgi:predicted GIY-YIG superfamily endonuclease
MSDKNRDEGRQPRVKNLYVIRLDDDVLELDKFRKKNPNYRSGKPCMYVGITSHDPKRRFKQHKEGYKSSRIAKKYGKYLMRNKFQHLNPLPAKEAESREGALATELRQKGYGVWQN